MSVEDFDRDGIAALESGEPLPDALMADPEAQAAAERHQQLVRRLSDATDGAAPPPDWQEQVWEGIAAEADRHRRGAVAWVVAAAVIGVGAVLAWWFLTGT